MTDNTKQLEHKFNALFPPALPQNEPGAHSPKKFDRAGFLKAAKDLQKIVKKNDKIQPNKS